MKETETLGKVQHTLTGWEYIEFKDHYDQGCSLQVSSLAEYEKPGTSAVWLGMNEVEPKVLASEASQYGIKAKETTGWVDYPIPVGVQLSSRMHLSRENVAALINHLQSWLDNDTLEL